MPWRRDRAIACGHINRDAFSHPFQMLQLVLEHLIGLYELRVLPLELQHLFNRFGVNRRSKGAGARSEDGKDPMRNGRCDREERESRYARAPHGFAPECRCSEAAGACCGQCWIIQLILRYRSVIAPMRNAIPIPRKMY